MKNDFASLYETAIKLVVERMDGKRRKGGERPMCIHSLRVGIMLDWAGEPEDVVLAGCLHDLTEDAGVSGDEIEALFGNGVRRLVDACSHDNDLHKSDRDASNDDLFRRAVAFGRDAIAVKVADATDNLADIVPLVPDRRAQLVERARRWYTAGKTLLGPQHMLVLKLGQRIKQAKDAIA